MPITMKTIQEARSRIQPYIRQTPVIRAAALDDFLDCEVYLKAECMQATGSFKLRGQRIFRMAPIHHHYELKGWPEPRVIVRFWIISLMLVLIGLATLKVR